MSSEEIVSNPVKVESVLKKNRHDTFNPYGWGWKDSHFEYRDNEFYFTGNRYSIANKLPFLNCKDYVKQQFEVDVDEIARNREKIVPPSTRDYPDPVECPEFCDELKLSNIDFSVNFEDRIYRCHGQSLTDTYRINFETFPRIVDLVIWPTSHEACVTIVKLANKYNVALIPVGGCTNVTEANNCESSETRMIASVDTSQMNRMLWLDKSSLLACFESGIVGQDLEKILASEGLCCGHEPDSIEFSTLGGWVSTRASGMKQQTYGNIEDIVQNIKLVTSVGVLERKFIAPRVSVGPDFNQFIMGTEGILGVITEVVIKVHPLPPVKKFGSIFFKDFSSGLRCMYELSKSTCQPSSLRLVDNLHYQTSYGFKQSQGAILNFMENVKKGYLSKIKGYDFKKLAIATYVFEGKADDVEHNERILIDITEKYDGYNAGPKYGILGYETTFYVAYIRDIMFQMGVYAESYETSVVWSKCANLCENVVSSWNAEANRMGIKLHSVSLRISQIYHTGVCVYIYFGLHNTTNDPFNTFKKMREHLYATIHECGGSLSHHHGIGKKLRNKYSNSISTVGIKMLKSIKKELDPKNIFAVGNLLTNAQEDEVPAKL